MTKPKDDGLGEPAESIISKEPQTNMTPGGGCHMNGKGTQESVEVDESLPECFSRSAADIQDAVRLGMQYYAPKPAAESVEAVPEWFSRFIQYHHQCCSVLDSEEALETITKLPEYQTLRKEFEGADVGRMLIELVQSLSSDSERWRPAQTQRTPTVEFCEKLKDRINELEDGNLHLGREVDEQREKIAKLEAEIERLKGVFKQMVREDNGGDLSWKELAEREIARLKQSEAK